MLESLEWFMLKTIKRIKQINRIVNELQSSMIVKKCIYMSGGIALTTLWDGSKVYVNCKDRSVAPHLLLNGEWEMDITKVFIEKLPKQGIVFDCGANHGYFGLLALSQSQSAVHFFEANKSLSDLVLDSVALNGWIKRGTVNNLAVSDRSGDEVTLTVPKGYLGSASLVSGGFKIGGSDLEISESAKVTTTSIDDYCDLNNIKYIDLIKIDVESYEEQVLKGASRLISDKRVGCIMFEYTPKSYSDTYLNWMFESFSYIGMIAKDGIIKKIDRKKIASINDLDDWLMLYCEM